MYVEYRHKLFYLVPSNFFFFCDYPCFYILSCEHLHIQSKVFYHPALGLAYWTEENRRKVSAKASLLLVIIRYFRSA